MPNGNMDPSLRTFIEIANTTRKENFEAKPRALNLSNLIDETWISLCSHTEANEDNPLCYILFMNGHNIFRGALVSAYSGHIAPTYPMIRTFIENCLYAYLIKEKPELTNIWLKRTHSFMAKAKCRNEFTATKSMNLLRLRDENLANLISEAYEGTIDHGAHPNIGGVFNNLSFFDHPTHHVATLTYLNGLNAETKRAIFATMETARAVLYLALHTLPKRSKVIGLAQTLEEKINPALVPEIFED